MQEEVTIGRDPICNMRLSTVGTLYARGGYQQTDPIYNRRLSMVGTLYAT